MKKNVIFLIIILMLSISSFSGCTESETEKITIESFTISPTKIQNGDTSLLVWIVTGADSVLIDNGIGSVSLSGSYIVQPEITTSYILTAIKGSNSKTASVQVIVEEPSENGDDNGDAEAESASVVCRAENKIIKITLTTGGDNIPYTGYDLNATIKVRINGSLPTTKSFTDDYFDVGESLYVSSDASGNPTVLSDSPKGMSQLFPADYSITVTVLETVIYDDEVRIV